MQVTAEMQAWRDAGQSYSQIAAKLGIGKTTVQEAFAGRHPNTGEPPAPAPVKAVGRSLSEFRQTYDKSAIVPAKVKAALKAIGSGWEYEVQFAKLAGVSLVDLATFRDQFSDHIVVVERTKRAWAGTVATANAMREML